MASQKEEIYLILEPLEEHARSLQEQVYQNLNTLISVSRDKHKKIYIRILVHELRIRSLFREVSIGNPIYLYIYLCICFWQSGVTLIKKFIYANLWYYFNYPIPIPP